MIFGESTTINTPVKESRYELGIEGALMHVYENECNFNAIMKSVALSEMKYYNETGGDLFVQEAGAKSGFLAKIKAFFEAIIKKIKSIFEKFMAKINQFRLDNDSFVKKYKGKLSTINLSGFEFEGYVFNDNNNWSDITYITDFSKLYDYSDLAAKSEEDIKDVEEKNRGAIVNDNGLDTSEFSSKLKEILYGDKKTLKIDNSEINNRLDIIKATNKSIEAVKNDQKKITDAINAFIKNDLEKFISKNLDNFTEKEAKEDVENKNKCLTQKIQIVKSYSNDLTVYFGAKCKALTDVCKQNKAICVKALSYKAKNESAIYGDDIFAGVQIV